MIDDNTSKAVASMEPETEAGRTRRLWPVIGVALLALRVGTASAGGGDDFSGYSVDKGLPGHLDPRVCRQHRLSERTRAWCDSIAGLSGRDLYKAILTRHLRRTKQPPVDDLRRDRVQPDQVDLNALDSTDEDGFPHIVALAAVVASTMQVSLSCCCSRTTSGRS